MKTVVVTGVSGFVGAHAALGLTRRGFNVRGISRAGNPVLLAPNVQCQAVGDYTAVGSWEPYLSDVDAIVHCGSIAASARDNEDNRRRFRETNVEVTRRLAESAAACGVKSFIYPSSIKVNGETSGSSAFSEEDPPNPKGVYAQSKWEAEQVLSALPKSVRTIIFRPPVIYGPGGRGGLYPLFRLIYAGVPLPLSTAVAARSTLYVENFIDAIVTALTVNHMEGIFFVADGELTGTAALAREIGEYLARRALLFPMPLGLTGRLGYRFERLRTLTNVVEPLVANTAKIQKLGWAPAFSRATGLARTASWIKSLTI